MHTITTTKGYEERINDLIVFTEEVCIQRVVSRTSADATVRRLIAQGFELHATTSGDARLIKTGDSWSYRITDYFDTRNWL